MTQQNPPLAVAASGLRKSFGDKTVLDGIDLAIPAGTIFALLGPNGAGKTTTVQILSTLIPASVGEVRVAGHDVRTAGLGGARLRVYCSKETHTWIQKAADIAGMGTDAIRWIAGVHCGAANCSLGHIEIRPDLDRNRCRRRACLGGRI